MRVPGDRALVVLLLVALGVTLWLVRPFLDVVLVSAVVAILIWPLHLRVLDRCGGRSKVAAALSLLLLTVGIVGPGSLLALFVGRELVELANDVSNRLELGSLDTLIQALVRSGPGRWLAAQMGGRGVLADSLEAEVRDAILAAARAVTQNVPGLLSVTAAFTIKITVFYFAVSAMLVRAPSLRTQAWRVSPLSPEHSQRLYEVFAQFARNVVLAGIAAGISQGVMATIGYALAGVERALLLGVVTGVLAYVPIVGTTVVWAPLCLVLWAEGRPGASLFLLAWSLVLTGGVDNIVKPFIVRGRSDVPLVLVLLGVFGGLYAFGVIGVLVGPVLMAMLLALLRIYAEGRPEVPPEP